MYAIILYFLSIKQHFRRQGFLCLAIVITSYDISDCCNVSLLKADLSSSIFIYLKYATH